jgi:hypothetical protein
MTDTIEVPDPEPDWEPAPQYQGGKRSPALQYFTFEQAIGDFRPIAGLKVRIADLARRLRLLLESGNSDLGPVDAAFFAIRRIGFAAFSHDPSGFTLVSLHHKDETSTLDALDTLLEALGVDWRAVATVAFGEGRDLRYIEPILDTRLRPTFPDTTAEDVHPASGT